MNSRLQIKEIQVRAGKPRPGEKSSGSHVAGNRYIVRWLYDGRERSKTFDSQGAAKAFIGELRQAHAQGMPFNPETGQPKAFDPPMGMLQFGREFVATNWPNWAPTTRQGYLYVIARTITLARTKPDTLASEEAARFVALLKTELHPALTLSNDERKVLEALDRRTLTFAALSQPLVLNAVYQALNQAPDGRRLARSSMRRYGTNFKSFIAAAIREEVVWNCLVSLKDQHFRATPLPKGHAMTQDEVRDLAKAMREATPSGGRYAALVLLMGVCGLRFGEATAITIGDFETDAQGRTWVKVSRTLRVNSKRHTDDGKTSVTYAGVKGTPHTVNADSDEAIARGRAVPVPRWLVDELNRHCEAYDVTRRDALLFTNNVGKPIRPSNFKLPWAAAVARCFPLQRDAEGQALPRRLQNPLCYATPHTCRHSAITAWFADDINPRIAMKWSGHASLVIFLDIYVNYRRKDEEAALQALDARDALVAEARLPVLPVSEDDGGQGLDEAAA